MDKKKIILIVVGSIVVCVVMGLGIAALLTMGSLKGISSVQSSERDTERKNVANGLNLMLSNYYNDNGSYPDKLVYDDDSIFISTDKTKFVNVTDVTRPTSVTDTKGTAYCYKNSGTSYGLEVQTEGNNKAWYNVGNETCESENLSGNKQ